MSDPSCAATKTLNLQAAAWSRTSVFFHQLHRTRFRKVTNKNVFFLFFKNAKKTHVYMTSKIHPPKHWHYEFFSYFGFGSKQSIAIFSAIQNVI